MSAILIIKVVGIFKLLKFNIHQSIYVIIVEYVDCGKPPNIKNGNVIAYQTRLNSVASYSCNLPYRISGMPFAECKENGLWKNIKECGKIHILFIYEGNTHTFLVKFTTVP